MTRSRVVAACLLTAGALGAEGCREQEPTAPSSGMIVNALTTRALADRTDAVAGSQVHVFYVLPKDGADRSLDVNGTLSNTVGSFQTWLSGQTGGRVLRLDTFQGNLDVTFFRMSRTDATLKTFGGFLREEIEGELKNAALLKPNKIYAAYYDGGNNETCGSGSWPPQVPGQVGALFLNGTPPGAPPCNTNTFATSPTAAAHYLEYAMLHELLHVQGFVSAAAPHETRNGHVSDDRRDLMWAGDLPQDWNPAILDVGRDDYFATSLPAGVLNLRNSSYLYRPNSWAAKAKIPIAREQEAVGAASGVIYVAGGWSGTAALANVQAYNTSANTWSTKAALPSARFQSDGTGLIGGLLYVAGGYGPGSPARETRTLYAYNPSTNAWTRKADLPVSSACGVTGVISGKLYVTTGCDGLTVAARWLHRYDAGTNTWTRLADAPRAHTLGAAGVIAGKLYVAGGFNDVFQASGNLDVYDPATNAWTAKAPMPTPRGAMAAGVINGKLIVVGGQGANGAETAAVEIYDPATNSWIRKTAMPAIRSGLGAAVSNGLLYAEGGLRNGTIVATNEVYTP